MLRIFDMTKLKNKQRNCLLGIKFGLGKGLLSTLGTQCSPEKPVSEGCSVGGVSNVISAGFKQRGPTMAILFSALPKNKAEEYATHD